MASRIIIIAAVFFVAVTLLYFTSASAVSYDMSKSTAKQDSIGDLAVRLSVASASSTIRVTVQNENPDQTISLLTWDSPLDPRALNTGTLTLEDAENGEEIPGPGIKLNRLLPPPRDALVEIAPKGSFSQEITLRSPWIPTDGRSVRVTMSGTWKAVWRKPTAEITDDELASMTGDEVLSGEFRSEALELQLDD